MHLVNNPRHVTSETTDADEELSLVRSSECPRGSVRKRLRPRFIYVLGMRNTRSTLLIKSVDLVFQRVNHRNRNLNDEHRLIRMIKALLCLPNPCSLISWLVSWMSRRSLSDSSSLVCWLKSISFCEGRSIESAGASWSKDETSSHGLHSSIDSSYRRMLLISFEQYQTTRGYHQK